jgi:hypothetical protein
MVLVVTGASKSLLSGEHKKMISTAQKAEATMFDRTKTSILNSESVISPPIKS